MLRNDKTITSYSKETLFTLKQMLLISNVRRGILFQYLVLGTNPTL